MSLRAWLSTMPPSMLASSPVASTAGEASARSSPRCRIRSSASASSRSHASNPAAACSRASSLRPATSVASVPIGHPGSPACSNPAMNPVQRLLQPGQRRHAAEGLGSARPPPARSGTRPPPRPARPGCGSSGRTGPCPPPRRPAPHPRSWPRSRARRTAPLPAQRSAHGWRARAWLSAHPACAHANPRTVPGSPVRGSAGQCSTGWSWKPNKQEAVAHGVRPFDGHPAGFDRGQLNPVPALSRVIIGL